MNFVSELCITHKKDIIFSKSAFFDIFMFSIQYQEKENNNLIPTIFFQIDKESDKDSLKDRCEGIIAKCNQNVSQIKAFNIPYVVPERLERERAEVLKKKQEAEALKKQQEAEELKKQEEAKALKKQQEAEALKKQEEAKALKKQQEAEALRKLKETEALKKQEEAKALKKQEEAKALKRQEEAKALKSNKKNSRSRKHLKSIKSKKISRHRIKYSILPQKNPKKIVIQWIQKKEIAIKK